MSKDYSYLPKLLAEIAEVAGLGPALLVARKKGGTRASFPAACQVASGNWLHDLVGREAALKIANRLTARGSIELDVPLGSESARYQARVVMSQMILDNRSSSEIALALRVSRRTVLRVKRRMRETTQNPQGSTS